MTESSKYLTLNGRTEGLYKEKGSKFIGIATPCYSEEEVKAYLQEWKKEHHRAGHLCYAYRLGVNKDRFRANDDGEPNNSAGEPILGQIKSYDLTNVLIGVVRYYGGTKLGVGGLINAYRTSAKEAIDEGEIVEKEVFQWIEITFDYSDMTAVMNWLNVNNLEMVQKEFANDCRLVTNLKLDSVNLADQISTLESINIKLLGIY